MGINNIRDNASEATESAIGVLLDKDKIKAQIYTVHGIRVMLDSDIAAYFGTETSALNRAMKRNIKRFPAAFCFQLTRDEYREILRCQTGTLDLEQGKYSKYPPYVYSEQGVAMLTAALHTDRAIEASIQIMEAFVEMSHYLRQNRQLLPSQEIYLLSKRQDELESSVEEIKASMITKASLSELMRLFDHGLENEEILILDGEPFKADEAYQRIYRRARQKITLIDDYIGIKTLHHLAYAKMGIKITVFSDNTARPRLTQQEVEDFLTDNPGRIITFQKTLHRVHDRYIVLDEGTKNMKVYHCGASSKDAGSRVTTIAMLSDIDEYSRLFNSMKGHPVLLMA